MGQLLTCKVNPGRMEMIISMKAKLIELITTSYFTWTAQVAFLGNAENNVGSSLEWTPVRNTSYLSPSLNRILVSVKRSQCGQQSPMVGILLETFDARWSCMLGMCFLDLKIMTSRQEVKDELVCFVLIFLFLLSCFNSVSHFGAEMVHGDLGPTVDAGPGVSVATTWPFWAWEVLDACFTRYVFQEGLCGEWNGFLQPGLYRLYRLLGLGSLTPVPKGPRQGTQMNKQTDMI